jgi:endothelin-converting enzyme/putative endopeptidase
MLALLPACSTPAPAPAPPLSTPPLAGPAVHVVPFDRSTLDDAVEPCTDFYQHVCGGWQARAPLDPSRGLAERASDIVAASTERTLHELLAGSEPTADAEVERLRTFFASCMGAADSLASDERTLAAWLERIDGARTRADLEAVLRDVHGVGVAAFFEYSGVADPTDPSRHRGQIHQGSFGSIAHLQTDDSPAGVAAREAYRDHIERMLVLSGVDAPRARREAEQVLALERTLAAATIAFEDQFDPERSEHVTSIEELRALVPHLDWAAYLARVGHPEQQPLNVTSPAYLAALERALATEPLPILRAYVRWQWLTTLGPALPAPLASEHARFVRGGRPRPPREQECGLATLESLGVELSRQFSRRALGPDARARAREVAERVRTELVEAVADAHWLSVSARRQSERKLRDTDLKLGYPDQWPSTGAFELREDAYLDDVLAARAYEQQRSWARARAPRRRDQWEMIVYPNVAHGMAAARLTLVNGFPDVFTNSIILPAASLQPPLFDAAAPPEVAYATLGTLVAHELTHVLENHEYDERGARRALWTEADVRAHRERSACVVEQADAFVAFESLHLDGSNTVEENMADLSGLELAQAAAERALGPRWRARGDDGLTGAQRFFYAYAQRWCAKMQPEVERERLRYDWHAPPRFRVNGPLSNMPAFAQAFACAEGSAMVRPASERCSAWGSSGSTK